MKRLFTALGFLTILPFKTKAPVKDEDLGQSLRYFPVTGFVIGLIGALIAYVSGFLPSSVTAIMILIVLALVTGAIHLDGFADTCDGLYGGKGKEEILRIMRDSRVGTMGVLGLALLILFKFSILSNLQTTDIAKAIIVSCVFSRWIQAACCVFYPYAREDGKAASFIKYATKKEFLYATPFALVLICAITGFSGLIICLTASPVIFLFMNCIKNRIGGMTGDTIGAVSEASEALILFIYLTYFRLWPIY